MSYYEIDNILALVDQTKTGHVTFDEFLMPAIDPRMLLYDSEKCYKIIVALDKNKRGGILLSELENGLKPKLPVKEYIWRKVMKIDDPEDKIYSIQIGFDQLKEILLAIFAEDSV